MSDLTKEQKELVKEAIDLVNQFPFEINQRTDKLPEYLAKMTLHPEILIQIFADISFKLYIIRHTKTEKETEKLSGFIMMMYALKNLSEKDHRRNLGFTISMMKMAFPLVGDDTVFEDLGSCLFTLFKERRGHIGIIFDCAMRINNYCAGCAIAVQQFIQVLVAHEAKSIESQPSWEYIGPIFKKCAAQIKPGCSTQEIGQIFNSYFYGEKEEDKLEHLLREHGDWKKKYIEKLGRNEASTEVAARMRKNYFKNFLTWMDRKEKSDRDLEGRIINFLEKSFWHKKTPEQLFAPVISRLGKKDITGPEAIMNELREFAKGIKVD